MSEWLQDAIVLEQRANLMMLVAEAYAKYVLRRDFALGEANLDEVDLARIEFTVEVAHLVRLMHEE